MYHVIHDRKPKNKRLASKIERIYTRISDVADDIYRALKQKNTAYFQRFDYVLRTPHFYALPRQPVDHSLIENGNAKAGGMNETQSDHCQNERRKDGQERCKISEKCWKLVMERHLSGYHLTHQALYFIDGAKFIKGWLALVV